MISFFTEVTSMSKIINTKEYGIIHKKTGEMYDLELRKTQNYLGGNWMIVNQDSLKILRDSNIRGETRRVFDYIIEQLGYHNIVPSHKRIIKDLNMNYSNLNRAFKQLEYVCAVVKDDEILILNPLWGWKGVQAERVATIKRLQDKGVKL